MARAHDGVDIGTGALGDARAMLRERHLEVQTLRKN